MKLTIQGVTPDCADGIYQISAKGFVAAALYWANKQEALPNWTPFAHIPVMADGTGKFIFTGHRGIPPGATCVLARAVSEDLKRCEEVLCPLPERVQPDVRIPPFRIAAIELFFIEGDPDDGGS